MPKIKTLSQKVREIRCEIFARQARKMRAKQALSEAKDKAIDKLCAEAQPKTTFEIIQAVASDELSQEQALALFNTQNKSKNKSFKPKARATLRIKGSVSTGFSQLNWDKIGR